MLNKLGEGSPRVGVVVGGYSSGVSEWLGFVGP